MKIKEIEWVPRQSDLDWFHGLTTMVKTGGIWACPCTESEWGIDSNAKEITLLLGSIDAEINKRTIKVAELCGWTVKYADSN